MEKELDSKLLIILAYHKTKTDNPIDLIKNNLSFLYSQLSIDTNCDILLDEGNLEIHQYMASNRYNYILYIDESILFHHLDLFLSLIYEKMKEESDFLYVRTVSKNLNNFTVPLEILFLDIKNLNSDNCKFRRSKHDKVAELELPDFIKSKTYNEDIESCFVHFPEEDNYKYLDALALLKTYYTHNLNSFFMGNTEDIHLVTTELKNRIGNLSRLVIPASGLLPLRILKSLGYSKNKKTQLFLYDISDLSLMVYKDLFEIWDGTNFPQFVEKQSKGLTKGEASGYDQWENLISEFKGESSFKEWFFELKEHLDTKFMRINAFTEKIYEAPWNAENNNGETLISFSNIFNFGPTSWFFNYSYRMQKINEIISFFQKSTRLNWIYLNYSHYDHGFKSKTILARAKDIDLIEVKKLPWEK